MKHITNFLIVLTILCGIALPAECKLEGGVDNSVQIDYTKLNESELEAKAEFFYDNALKNYNGKLSNDMTTALNMYTILSNVNKENIIYPLRLGKLYDLLGKDRYAKSNYYRAIGINPAAPDGYYYLGDYYYERNQFRKALKMYGNAYDRGYTEHIQMLDKIEKINKKLGIE